MDEEPEGGSLDLDDLDDGTAEDDAVPIDVVEVEEKGPTRFQMIEYMNQREWPLNGNQ